MLLTALILLIGEILEYMALKIDPNEPKVEKVFDMKAKNFNTLILGNSISQQAFNPDILDSSLSYNSYNMAIGGSSIFEMELILRHYLRYNENPDRIIYGIYVNETEWPNRVRPSVLKKLDESILENRFYGNKNVEREPSLELYNYFKIFRYRNVIEHFLKYIFFKKRFTYEYLDGFIIKKNRIGKVEKLSPNVAGINVRALRDFIDFCDEENIDLIFVEPPNHQAFNLATINRAEVLKKLNRCLSEELFINLNQPEYYNPDDWAGINHLNYWGANKFTRTFSDSISSRLYK